MEGPYLGSTASIRSNYGQFLEACSVVNESVPSSVDDLLSLAICGVETMVSAFILEVQIGALE